MHIVRNRNEGPSLDTILERAASGDADAQFAAGNHLEFELSGSERDLEQARLWYERAAGQDHPKALVRLAQLRLTEPGDAPEAQRATEAKALLETATRSGDLDALCELANLLVGGYSSVRDLSRGLELYKEAARLGHTTAMRRLAALHLEGDSLPLDRKAAGRLLGEAMKQGDLEAHCELAQLLLEVGQPKGRAEALRILERAANLGSSRAQRELGLELLKDWRKAPEGFQWMMEAARAGDAEAQFEAARCCRAGKGADTDPGTALGLFWGAAEQGHTEAQYQLGFMLDRGLGVDDAQPAEASVWFWRAIQKGHPEAAFSLAALLEQGRGVPQDLERALQLYEYAISLGNEQALLGAAMTCARMNRVVHALAWATLAVDRCRKKKPAQHLIDRITPVMSVQQQCEAAAEAAALTQRYAPAEPARDPSAVTMAFGPISAA